MLGRKLKDVALDKVVIDALYYERLTALQNGDEAALNQVRDEIILYNKDINPEASDDFKYIPRGLPRAPQNWGILKGE
jgi:hypothetical protein